METRTGSLSFPRARDIGPRTANASFNFTNPVRAAAAVLTGTNFGFSPRDDHHLGMVNVRLSTAIDDDVVTVEGTFGVRDWSNNWDDDYEGSIQFVLLAELEIGFVPSNLSITGIEYNQTIQFFRSKLDPATARPDNSIGLIAEKNTILRVFVDTQNDPARPTIAAVSGLLEIRLSGGAAWNPVMLLNGPIPPKSNSAIDRVNANDTLTFFIPGAFCTGTVDYRVRVFDSAHPSQPGYTSGTVQGALQFTSVAPLRVRGVGIHYTGKGLNIAAPDVAALRTTLSFVLKNYPVGQVFITGFDVIDYAGNFQATSDGGCGSGWSGLLSRLREMQGDSNDVYFGLVPPGVPTGGTVGCGGGDGRVASGFVNDGPTAAQEIAHAFGRRHAPCGNPGKVDTNYPVYDALPIGSIGEVGMDDQGNPQDPATTTDFMSYCSPNWVSPYTYEALRQSFPSIAASARALSRGALNFPFPPERRRVAAEHLFLSFRIFRGGKVELLPSFHYLSLPTIKTGEWTPYAIELRGRHNEVLQAQRIWLTDPHGTLDSAVLDFFKPVPFDPDTTRVVFTCGSSEGCEQKELLAVDVPQQEPKVRIVSPAKGKELSGNVRVSWEGHFGEKQLHYLVRYSNDGGQSWRTLTPRLRTNEFTVDVDRLPGGEQSYFQVLATEGIRTGTAVSEAFRVPERPREVTIVTPTGGTTIPPGETLTLTGEAYSSHAGSAPPSELRWQSDLDGPLGTGQEIRVSSLRPGTHQISLQAPDGCGEQVTTSVQIDVKPPKTHKHTSLTHPGHTSKDHDSGKVPYKPQGGSRHGDKDRLD